MVRYTVLLLFKSLCSGLLHCMFVCWTFCLSTFQGHFNKLMLGYWQILFQESILLLFDSLARVFSTTTYNYSDCKKALTFYSACRFVSFIYINKSKRAATIIQKKVMRKIYTQILRLNKQTQHDYAWVSEYRNFRTISRTFFPIFQFCGLYNGAANLWIFTANGHSEN